MSYRAVHAHELADQAYYIAKGVRKIALFDVVIRTEDDIQFWQMEVNRSIGHFQQKLRGCYTINYLARIWDWHCNDRKRRVLQIVIYRSGWLKDAQRVMELTAGEREPEQTKELGLLLGYAPELVEEFVYGEQSMGSTISRV